MREKDIPPEEENKIHYQQQSYCLRLILIGYGLKTCLKNVCTCAGHSDVRVIPLGPT